MIVPAATRDRLSSTPRPLWPLLLVRDIWVSAVVDEEAVRFNLRLLWTLTAVFSLPDLAQGLLLGLHAPPGGARLYGLYVLVLGALELGGATLLAARRALGRRLIMAAAAGFYVEAVLGLAHFERTLLAAAVFAACIPAEAWVLWFLTHPHVRAYVAAHYRPARLSPNEWRDIRAERL